MFEAFRRPTKIPFVQQMEAVECGAASLTMVLRYFGHHAELAELREATGVSRDGISAKSIVLTARKYGLEPRARKLEPEDLAEVQGPAILHWEMNHFVVFDRWSKNGVYLLDPAVGPRIVSLADFDTSFTGVCIEFKPGEAFRKKPRQRAALARYRTLLAEVQSPVALLVLSSLLLNIFGLGVPIATQVLADQVLANRQTSWLGIVGLALAVLLVSQWLLGLQRGLLVARLRQHLDARTGESFVRHLFSLPMRVFAQRYTADLVSRVQASRSVRELFTGAAVALFVDGVLLCSYLALALAYEARLGLVIVAGLILYALSYYGARNTLLSAYRERAVKDTRREVELLQTLAGVVTLKSAGREESAYERWSRRADQADAAGVQEARVQDLVGQLLFLVRVTVPSVVLLLGSWLVMQQRLTLGALLGVQFLQGAIFAPFERIIGTLLRMQELPVQFERMDDVLLTETEPQGRVPCPRLEGELTFENVCFRYGPTAPLTLDNVSFTVRKGEKLALVGPSGSGKSTIGRLLTGLYRPESGRILLDGRDLAELDLHTVREQLGVVLQETAVFDGTVRENIALYRPHAPLADVVNAARVAQIHDAIEALPKGYETPISPSSCPLSGGQRQRLALARAVLHRPAVLLLDEATSALDTVTEAAVESFLGSLLCTRIVIAHRLSTVRDADVIIVLDKGKVTEQGHHAELVAQGGLYAGLIAQQTQEQVTQKEPTQTAVEEKPKEQPITAAELERFAPLAQEGLELDAVAQLLERRVFEAGATILQQGVRGPGLYLICSGKLDVVLSEQGVAPFKLGEHGAGAVLGEVSLLTGSAAGASLVATERVEALHLPARVFEQLRAEQDPLGARLILALGKVIAGWLRDRLADRAALGERAGTELSSKGTQRSSTYELRLEETALGAALNPAERARMERLGTVLRYDAGAMLFEQGSPGTDLFLVLRGKLGFVVAGVPGYVAEIRPGDVVGEAAFFDGRPQEVGCEALEPVTVFAIENTTLRQQILGSSDVAWKVLRSLVHSMVEDLRLATLRYREAAALKGDEFEAARKRREEAERIAQEEEQALAALEEPGARGKLPTVLESDKTLSGAACVTAVLRSYGRAVRKATVLDACSAEGTITQETLASGARGFGMIVRLVALTPEELPFLEHPLIVSLRAGGFVVAERWSNGRLRVMDPTRGMLWFAPEQYRELAEEAIELRPDEHASAGVALSERVFAILRERKSALIELGFATVMMQLAALAMPAMTGFVLGTVLPSGTVGLLQAAVLGLAAVLLGQAITGYARARAVLYLRMHLDRELLRQMFRHLLRLPLQFFERNAPGELVERFAALRALRSLLGTDGLVAMLDVPAMALAIVYLLALEPRLFLVVGASALGHVLVFALSAPRYAQLAKEQYTATSEQRDRLMSVLGGITQVRLTGDEETGMRFWAPSFARELRLSARQDTLGLLEDSALLLLRAGTVSLTLYLGASKVVEGTLTLGALMAFLALSGSFFASLESFLARAGAFLRAREALTRIRETFAEAPEQSGEGIAPPGHLRGHVKLEGVSFGYTKDGPRVLQDISLEIAPGSKVALVGGSGAGKSTLGRLLLGFYVPDSGRILYDGRDLRGIDLPRLRNQFGVVLQESFLFTGSIRQNLALGAPDATMDRIVRAATRAAMHDDINAMPMKYETVVTERGGAFSGGQRQRLSLARALVHDPAILLLDEATSALDNRSQRVVETQLATLSCTRIVIAHRLSTVVDADKIVVLDKGKIVEQGTHEELLARKGHYYRLVEAQLS